MENNYDIIVSYDEYLSISNKAKMLQSENQGLKETIETLNTQLQRQKQEIFLIKECEYKLKVLSMNHIKALKMVLKLQSQQTQSQKVLKQKETLLAMKTDIIQASNKKAQQLQQQADILKAASLYHSTTIKTLKNDLLQAEKLRVQYQKMKEELSQLLRQTQKKCKKCIKLQDQLKRKQIQARIMIQDEKDEELYQLRQQIKVYKQQAKKQRKQSQQSIKQISSLSPIIERYYDWLQNPQSKLLTTFCLTIQRYRQKLLNLGHSSQILQHLQVKKKSIDKLLQKEFKKIMQTSTLMLAVQQS